MRSCDGPVEGSCRLDNDLLLSTSDVKAIVLVLVHVLILVIVIVITIIQAPIYPGKAQLLYSGRETRAPDGYLLHTEGEG